MLISLFNFWTKLCASVISLGDLVVWTRKPLHQPLCILKKHRYPGRFYVHCLVLELSWGYSQTDFPRKYYTCKRIFTGPGSAILLANRSLACGKALCCLLVEFVFYLMKMAVSLNVWSNLLFSHGWIVHLKFPLGKMFIKCINNSRMYDGRFATQVHREPMASLHMASDITGMDHNRIITWCRFAAICCMLRPAMWYLPIISDVEFKRAGYTTLMESLTHGQVILISQLQHFCQLSSASLAALVLVYTLKFSRTGLYLHREKMFTSIGSSNAAFHNQRCPRSVLKSEN